MDLMMRRAIIMGQPQGITLKNYIKGDGTAWIDTGYYLPENAVIFATNVWGGYGSNKALCGTDATWIRQTAASGSTRIGWKYNGGTEAANNLGNYFNPSKEMPSLWITPTHRGINNSSYTLTKGSVSSTTSLCIMECYSESGMTKWNYPMGPVYVYGSDAAGITSAADLESYTPVASFIPCTFGYQAGMYYVEGDRFCGNANTSGVLRAYDTWPA